MFKIARYICILLLFTATSQCNRNILIEFKTSSIFLPINHQPIMFGPEITFQFNENTHWYGFASTEFLIQPHIVPAIFPGLGIKYFIPTQSADLYVGFGFQPIITKFFNERIVLPWFVAKVGCYFNLQHNFLLHIFTQYNVAFTAGIGAGYCF